MYHNMCFVIRELLISKKIHNKYTQVPANVYSIRMAALIPLEIYIDCNYS